MSITIGRARARLFPLAAAFALLPGHAYAGPPPSKIKQEYCTKTAQLAQSIMSARQHGMPVTEAIKVAQRAPEGPARDVGLALVKDAYAESAWNGDGLQRKAITDFGAAKYVACMDAAPD